VLFVAAIANRQSGIDNSEDWLPLDEAAAELAEPLRTLQWRCRSSLAKQHQAHLSPPRDGRGKPVWWLHRSIDPRLSRSLDPQTRADQQRPSLLARHAQHHVERAYRKARWVGHWRSMLHDVRPAGLTGAAIAARVVAEAKQVEGEDFPISVRSLYLWNASMTARDAEGAIRGVEALVPRYGDGGGGRDVRSPEAVEFFYELYHCQSKPTVRTCHEVTLRKSRANGWTWPTSYSATRKWLAAHDDLSLTFLFREGRDAWNRRYMPHLEIDYSVIEPGELYVCDHTQCDFWVEHGGEQLRPWLSAIQDGRSRCIVGWHLGVAPHQDAILSAMRRAFRWAIPKHMRIDNGKDFTSALLAGVTKRQRDALRRELGGDWRRIIERDENLADCVDPRFKGIVPELGIELIYAKPYAAWSKGTLERFFGAFEDQCGKTFATYCGNSTMTRPECLETIRRGYTKDQKRVLRKRYGKAWKRVAVLRFVDKSAVPTLEQAREAVGEWMEIYHRTVHRGDGMDGRTPLDVWNTATALCKAPDDSLLLLLQSRGVYRVGPNGVRFKVGSETLGYGSNCAALNRLRGRDVFVTIDPDDLSFCCAFTADAANRKFIARLESNDRISPLATIDDLRDASATIGRRRKVAHKAERQAPARTRNVAEELRAHRHERLRELRATGTDGRPPDANIRPVQTGFEGVSVPVSGPHAQAIGRERSIYDDVDISKIDFTAHEEPVPDDPYAAVSLADLDCSIKDDRDD
jgi:transposase InsO family protein